MNRLINYSPKKNLTPTQRLSLIFLAVLIAIVLLSALPFNLTKISRADFPVTPPITPPVTPTPTLSCGQSVLDQAQLSNYIPQKLGTGWGVGEPLIFSPTKKGLLDKVELFVSGKGDIQVKVVNNVNGKNKDLTETITLPVNLINGRGSWLTFDFKKEPLIYKGLNYTVTFRSISGTVYVHRATYWNWARKIYIKPCQN